MPDWTKLPAWILGLAMLLITIAAIYIFVFGRAIEIGSTYIGPLRPGLSPGLIVAGQWNGSVIDNKSFGCKITGAKQAVGQVKIDFSDCHLKIAPIPLLTASNGSRVFIPSGMLDQNSMTVYIQGFFENGSRLDGPPVDLPFYFYIIPGGAT